MPGDAGPSTRGGVASSMRGDEGLSTTDVATSSKPGDSHASGEDPVESTMPDALAGHGSDAAEGRAPVGARAAVLVARSAPRSRGHPFIRALPPVRCTATSVFATLVDLGLWGVLSRDVRNQRRWGADVQTPRRRVPSTCVHCPTCTGKCLSDKTPHL